MSGRRAQTGAALRMVAHGLVVDERGQVLLVRRGDGGHWSLPGAIVEHGELPPETAQREVEAETGLKTVAVRLVGAYFTRLAQGDVLDFDFRCLRRGGELKTADEAPRLGYFPVSAPPDPGAVWRRARVAAGVRHDAAAPRLAELRPYGRGGVGELRRRAARLGQRLTGRATRFAGPAWSVRSIIVLRDPARRVLWVRPPEGPWRLPAADAVPGRAPWATADRAIPGGLTLETPALDLEGVYLLPERRLLLLLGAFLPADPIPSAARGAWFAPGDEPAETPSVDRTLAAAPPSPPAVRFERLTEGP